MLATLEELHLSCMCVILLYRQDAQTAAESNMIILNDAAQAGLTPLPLLSSLITLFGQIFPSSSTDSEAKAINPELLGVLQFD